MTPDEIEVALKVMFKHCEAAACPLSDQQKEIVRQALRSLGQSAWIQGDLDRSQLSSDDRDPDLLEIPLGNPLDQLTDEERRSLFAFIRQQESQNLPWKITLLNDWLAGRASGPVQFIRERYGVQWLEQIQPIHLANYNDEEQGEVLRLKVGDRIEVTNGLWEWVQDTGPCSREWFPCTIVSLREPPESADGPSQQDSKASCIVRFQNGAEYEIQGVYDWNRPNWRWLGQD